MSDASRTHVVGHELALSAEHVGELIERALQLPDRPDSWWHRAGMSPRAERWLEAVSSLVLLTLAIAWLWTIVETRAGVEAQSNLAAVSFTTRAVAAALTDIDAPSTAYLTETALEAFAPIRGASGKVDVVMAKPGDSLPSGLPAGTEVVHPSADSAVAPDGSAPVAPTKPGVWQLVVDAGEAVRSVADLSVITLTPLSERHNGRIGLYYIGTWPTERTRHAAARTRRGAAAQKSTALARADYSAPAGLIQVTPDNQDTPLSEHFKLRDFLTHDQPNVWPKYVVVQTRIVDKLELVLSDLEAHGVSGAGVHVMSGFRTPQYNVKGGDPRGRAELSRHMYGDAADIWIDNAGRGQMDDLNHDGRVDTRDAQVICDAVTRVEHEHPELAGGCGIYPGSKAHGPFTHVDARGYIARWTGTGEGG